MISGLAQPGLGDYFAGAEPLGVLGPIHPLVWIIFGLTGLLVLATAIAVRKARYAARQARELSGANAKLSAQEGKLRQSNEQLEARVSARTAELAIAVERLRASQSRLTAMLAGGGIGTWFWNLDTDEVWWDEAVTRLLGLELSPNLKYNHETFIGRVHPEDRAALRAAMERTVQTRSPFSAEYRLQQSDGTFRWIAARGGIESDESGRPNRMVGACLDVTEQKRAAEAFRKSEDSYRFMADAQPQMIWTATPNGTLDYFNQRVFDYSGMNFEGLRGSGWMKLLHPDDAMECTRRWKNALEYGHNYEIEYRLKRALDGMYRWHLARAFPQRGEDGKIIRWVGTCTDIHDQKEASHALESLVAARNAELAASERRLRLLTNSLPVLIGFIDRDQRYQFTNRTYRDWFGIPPESFVGHTMREMLGEDYPAFEPYVQRVLAGERVTFEHRFTRCQPPRMAVVNYVPQIGDNGFVEGFYVLKTDITARRQAEETLKENEDSLKSARDEALEASRLKSEFLATMSHEIRTPMNGIIGMASLLAETPLNPQQLEMGQVIRRSAEGLLQIINDILDFSKIEAGKMRLEREPFNLRDVLEETVSMLAANAHKKKLEFICHVEPTLGCMLEGDPGRIQQVVTNLLSNAIKFTEGVKSS